jgi:hypothetical protein
MNKTWSVPYHTNVLSVFLWCLLTLRVGVVCNSNHDHRQKVVLPFILGFVMWSGYRFKGFFPRSSIVKKTLGASLCSVQIPGNVLSVVGIRR